MWLRNEDSKLRQPQEVLRTPSFHLPALTCDFANDRDMENFF